MNGPIEVQVPAELEAFTISLTVGLARHCKADCALSCLVMEFRRHCVNLLQVSYNGLRLKHQHAWSCSATYRRLMQVGRGLVRLEKG
jgi:hypothetical protein